VQVPERLLWFGTEMGYSMGHAIVELDVAVSYILRMLKEEGELSVDRANIGDLKKTQ